MELNQKIIDASYKLMNYFTKGYQWYHDTPERPFEYSEGSIWLINPKTKEWILEWGKSGKLWYYHKTPVPFSRYVNMEVSDFESFIKVWVEDVLKRGVVSTGLFAWGRISEVEDVLKRGVVSTHDSPLPRNGRVEDVLKRGVVSTDSHCTNLARWVEDVLKRGVVSTHKKCDEWYLVVEDVLKNGKQWN